jgi:ubiquinone/menaquinone biosynthesis C-methylase UbiE
VSLEDTERLAAIYSSQAQGYADCWGPVIRPLGQRLLQALPWDGARRVVDLGTGAGTHLPEIRRLARGACVVGVDRSAGMLDLGRQHGLPLVLMDGVELAFRNRSIDVAVMAFVLFHLDDPVVAMREVCRVLHPGGAVGTVTWPEDPEIEASRVWEAELDAHGARDPVAPRPRRDGLLNTPEKMTDLFSATGFDTLKVWVERFEHHWGLDELSLMHMTLGRSKRKLESLAANVRAAFLAHIHDRLLGLPPEAFIYRAAVMCGVACRTTS